MRKLISTLQVNLKKNMSKKVAGVWMDSEKAIIVATKDRTSTGSFEIIATVNCGDHEGANYKNERVEQSKENQENKKYFKEIASHIDGDNEIYIFGPGKAQEQFKNFLEDYQNFNSKEITLGTSGKISNNELIEAVDKFFS